MNHSGEEVFFFPLKLSPGANQKGKKTWVREIEQGV